MVTMTLRQLRELLHEMVDPFGPIPTVDDPTGTVALAGQLYDAVSGLVTRQIEELYDEGRDEEAAHLDKNFDDEVMSALNALVRQAMPQKIDLDKLRGTA